MPKMPSIETRKQRQDQITMHARIEGPKVEPYLNPIKQTGLDFH